MKSLIAGNWKMHGLKSSLAEIDSLGESLSGADRAKADVLICPPAGLIGLACTAGASGHIAIGGQDCHVNEKGAHTGDISAEMLADLGATAVIIGHSERRADHAEADALVKAKAEAAHRAGLMAIVCVGESLEQREAGQAVTVVISQAENSLPSTKGTTVLAYEPIWAIGTGLTPTLDDIEQMHGALRSAIGPEMRLLYGGSVKPANAAEILAVSHVNGALVGGASLKAKDFYGIIAAL